MAGEWVAIIAFIMVTTIVVTFLILHFKHKQRLQDTLQLAIENGQALSSETVDSLLVKNKPFNDLKKGVLFISLGFAVSTFLFLVSNETGTEAAAMGLFPIIIGLGYIVIWKLRPKYDV